LSLMQRKAQVNCALSPALTIADMPWFPGYDPEPVSIFPGDVDFLPPRNGAAARMLAVCIGRIGCAESNFVAVRTLRNVVGKFEPLSWGNPCDCLSPTGALGGVERLCVKLIVGEPRRKRLLS